MQNIWLFEFHCPNSKLYGVSEFQFSKGVSEISKSGQGKRAFFNLHKVRGKFQGYNKQSPLVNK